MKWSGCRIVSWFLLAVCSFSLIVPVYANEGSNSDSEYTQKSNFWHWIAGAGSPLNGYVGYTFGAVCSESEDSYHHATSYEQYFSDGYYRCICSYCGKDFTAYASDLRQSYNNQVEEMKKGKKPTQITSSGSFIIHAYDIWDGTGEVAKRNTSNSASWKQFTTLATSTMLFRPPFVILWHILGKPPDKSSDGQSIYILKLANPQNPHKFLDNRPGSS